MRSQEFRRQRHGLLGKMMSSLPDMAPNTPIIRFDWHDFRSFARLNHYVIAFFQLLFVLLTITILFKWAFFRQSFLSLAISFISRILGWNHNHSENTPPSSTSPSDPSFLATVLDILIIAFVVLVIIALFRFLPQFAMKEEQEFRQGAENWSWGERIRSSAIFGAVHLTHGLLPFFIPFGVGIALAFNGMGLMLVYLRSMRHNDSIFATMEAASVHTAYNVLALLYLLSIIF